VGLWIKRYRENEELRQNLEKLIKVSRYNNLCCYITCIGYEGFSCSLFDNEILKEDGSGNHLRTEKCIKIFGKRNLS